jgi:acyl-coenzyme A thioesterase PaaI-like protein
MDAARSDHHCFGCGDRNPIGLHLQFSRDEQGVSASFIPQPAHQGFEETVHGGIISTVLDEAMAWAIAAAGIWAMTGEMRIRFRRPLRVGETSVVTARVTGQRGPAVMAAAELALASDAAPIASATATFARVDEETATAWQARYTRRDDERGEGGGSVVRRLRSGRT